MSLPVRTEKEASSGSDIPVEWFAPLKQKQDERESVARPSLSYWQNAWRILRKNKLAMAGLGVLIFLFFMAALGPVLSPHSVTQQTLSEQNLPPSTEHWFGTDEARTRCVYKNVVRSEDFSVCRCYGGFDRFCNRRHLRRHRRL